MSLAAETASDTTPSPRAVSKSEFWRRHKAVLSYRPKCRAQRRDAITLLLVWIFHYQGMKPDCRPSRSTLALNLGVCARTVTRRLRVLEDAGIIDVRRCRRGWRLQIQWAALGLCGDSYRCPQIEDTVGVPRIVPRDHPTPMDARGARADAGRDAAFETVAQHYQQASGRDDYDRDRCRWLFDRKVSNDELQRVLADLDAKQRAWETRPTDMRPGFRSYLNGQEWRRPAPEPSSQATADAAAVPPRPVRSRDAARRPAQRASAVCPASGIVPFSVCRDR